MSDIAGRSNTSPGSRNKPACVRATATDAKSNELRPIVIREAVQDRSEILHEFHVV